MLERHRTVFEALRSWNRRCTPLTAVVELTRRCNLRCVMCYATPDRGRAELTAPQLFDLIDQIHDLGALFVTFLGGDPTMRAEFVDLVHHAQKRRLAVQILTNGLLIDERVADAISGVFHVGLTLLGANPATHDALARRAGAFAGVERAARLLKARGVNVAVKVLMMRENAHEVDAMTALAESWGAPATVNPSLTPTDRGSAAPWRHRLTGDEFRDAVKRHLDSPERRVYEDGADLRCQMGVGYMAVNAYGDVLPCITVPIPAGNVRYAPLRTIWEESPFLRTIRGLDPMRDLHGCPECAFRSRCNRCYGLAFTETGDLFGPQPGACLKAEPLLEIEARPPGLLHTDSRFWTVGDILEAAGLACSGA